jgi:hypothetical protein
MNSKIVKKILLVVAVLSLLFPSKAFAETGAVYVPKPYNIPIIHVARIDMTNNQIEFRVSSLTVGSRKIKEVELLYLPDGVDEEQLLDYDLSEMEGVKTAFKNSENFEEYYVDMVNFYRSYIVDTFYDLKENEIGEMMFVVRLESGEAWVDKIDYKMCKNLWKPGADCYEAGFVIKNEVNSTIYSMAVAPERYVPPEKIIETVVVEVPVEKEPDEAETGSDETGEESENTGNSETESESKPESGDNNETGVEIEKNTEEAEENVEKQSDNQNTELSSEIVIDDSYRKKEIIIDNSILEETDNESHEGPGETTLDVPVLGKVETEVKEDSSWLNWFLIGFCSGTILTSFLFLTIKRVKDSRVE